MSNSATLLDSIIVNENTMCDIEMLLNGSFSPLNGFLCKEDYVSVLDECRLSRGCYLSVWPMPIVLRVEKPKFKSLFGEDIEVLDMYSSEQFLDYYTKFNMLSNISVDLKYYNPVSRVFESVARLIVEDIYEPDIEKECLKVFGTTCMNHPSVKELLPLKDNVFYIGGKILPLDNIIHYDFHNHRYTPAQIKEFINYSPLKESLTNAQKHKSLFTHVIGFQTRNPMHNCHYQLSLKAVKEAIREDNNAKPLLLLQPIVGVTQPGDIDYRVRVRCYQHLLNEYAKDGIEVKLCLLRLNMRMAGPREALWHALIRKNYGCTHFVVGRDHAGPSSTDENGRPFYGPYDAHHLIQKYEDEIGIKVILSKMLVYNKTEKMYKEIGQTIDNNNEHISGTELRRLLRNRDEVPEWFTKPEISRELHRYYSPFIHSLKNCNGEGTGGIVFYFIGLSGAGKSTLANAFSKKLEEKYDPRIITVLDGDEIRTNLSTKLGFTREDRSINVRRIGYVASLLARSGGIVLCANIAPFQEDRDWNRELISRSGKYVEVYVRTPLKICEDRDVKGLYKRARAGIIPEFTGITSPFEEPENYDISVNGNGGETEIHNVLAKLMTFILE